MFGYRYSAQTHSPVSYDFYAYQMKAADIIFQNECTSGSAVC